MPAPELCRITDTIYDGNGVPAKNVKVYMTVAVGVDVITNNLQIEVARSDDDGVLQEVIDGALTGEEGFNAIQSTDATIQGNFHVNGVDYVSGGTLSIPSASSSTLRALQSAASFSPQGAIVQQTGTALPHPIGTFNFGSGITVVESATGVALITAAAAVVTAEEVQDALATFFADSGAYDWTYDDALNKVSLVIAPASTSVNGLMSAADKTLFDAVPATYVPITRTVNGHALSSNVTVTPTDLSLVIGVNTQAWDADLDAFAALAPSNDDILQRKAGAWANRTIAQLKTDLAYAAIATSGSASDLSTGTIPDARFPATLPAISGANLTALNASNISTGTLLAARLPATAALTGSSLAQFAATTSLELKTLISDETGSGALVFATSPTLVTPVLGVASATSLTVPSLIGSSNILLTDSTIAAGNLELFDTFAHASTRTISGRVVRIAGLTSPLLVSGNNFVIGWTSVTPGAGSDAALTYDVNLTRNGIGILQVGTSAANALGTIFAAKHQTATSVFWSSGTGSPASVVVANIGSLYTQTDGGTGSTLWVKESGNGLATGWVAK